MSTTEAAPPPGRPPPSSTGDPATLGVLIATYRRPDDLVRCLHALVHQTRRPDDVMVVVRDDDEPSRRAVLVFPPDLIPLRMITVLRPGLVEARTAGCHACRTDVLAMIDDDTAPHPEWGGRVLRHFQADPRIGGLGGRDRCHDGQGFDECRADVVGRIQWFGRIIGNHHRGHGAARQVDLLKGANMSYRARVFSQVQFDRRLRGTGAQPSEDIAFSVKVRHAGWTLLYDPAVLVDHYLGHRDETRHYGGIMPVKDPDGFRDFAFNEVVALWDIMTPVRRAAFVAWSFLVGTGVCPGLVQAVRFTPRMGRMSWRRFSLAQQGKFAAFRQLVRAPRATTVRQPESHA